jgi:hypothetical protein
MDLFRNLSIQAEEHLRLGKNQHDHIAQFDLELERLCEGHLKIWKCVW